MKYLLPLAISAILLSVQANAHQAVDKRLLNQIKDVPLQERPDKPGQIKRGEQLFLKETFGGNGRTCGTCHEPTNNFTIDPAFIATLPPTSPLFVNETQPALAGLENSQLLRGFGLICKNLDGFNLPCVFRGVPHTLGLPTSIKSDVGTPTRPPFPLANALGWSGDGAPGTGSLREFALGAIVQHFTKDPLRRPGVDFRLPTKQELKQMEAFQLSLGRRKDISLDGDDGIPATIFKDPTPEAGKRLFVAGVPGRAGTVRSCNACHNDASAHDQDGNNRQFDTGIRLAANAPGCRNPVAPGDGGFLFTPITTGVLPCGQSVTFRGNGQFNTPPLIEAADTPPFFSNNSADTIEHAIVHYTSDAFNNSPSGGGNAFVLNTVQVGQLGAMLRTLNAQENLRDGIVLDQNARTQGKPRSDATIRVAISQTRDALRVLNEAAIPIYQATTICPLLTQIIAHEQQALAANGATRDAALNKAITKKRKVQAQL